MRILLVVVLLALLACSSAVMSQSAVRCTPPQPWVRDVGEPPAIPMTGDVDNDGYCDIISLSPQGSSSINLSLNDAGVKSTFGFKGLEKFGEEAIGACSGEFGGTKGADVMAVFKDGSIRIAHSYSVADKKFTGTVTIGNLDHKPVLPVVMASGDIDNDGISETVFVEANGSAWLIKTSPKAEIKKFGRCNGARNGLSIAHLRNANSADCVGMDVDGRLWRASVTNKGFGKSRTIIPPDKPAPFCTGDLDADGKDDIVVGSTVIWGGNARNTSVWSTLDATAPGILLAGDMNGDKKADILRLRRGDPAKDYYLTFAGFVYHTYKPEDTDYDHDGLTNQEETKLGTDPVIADTDRDGLPDGWEVKEVRGLDLPKLGCNPLHKDVIVELRLHYNSNFGNVDNDLPLIKLFYANLRMRNPDGTRGINFIPIMGENMPKDDEVLPWWELGNKYFNKSHRGIAHWMSAGKDGGGQSNQMGDMGCCGTPAYYATFTHEFGHQLGLSHEGFYELSSPTYTSLMNYCYSYSFEDTGAIHYSNGRLDKLKLNGLDLSEVLPVKYKYVKFLSMAPYHFKLKPDGDNTLIDWNWNGILGEDHVRADVAYGYSTSCGEYSTPDKAWSAPFLVSHGKNDLLIIYAKEPSATGTGQNFEMLPDADKEYVPDDSIRGGQTVKKRGNRSLVFKWHIGGANWVDKPVVISQNGIEGDPVATSDGKAVWVCYPTSDGVKCNRLYPENGKWRVGDTALLPSTQGMQGTPIYYNKQLYVMLWIDNATDVKYIMQTPSGWTEPKSMGFASTFPVGAAVDIIKNQLIVGCGQDAPDGKLNGRWVIRWFKESDNNDLTQDRWCWVQGEKGNIRGKFRPCIIFQSDKNAGPEGRISFISTGYNPDGRDWDIIFKAEQIADKSISDGWMVKLYGNEWLRTRSSPAAAWFNDDIVFCLRWAETYNTEKTENDLRLGYNGLGIPKSGMADFDDVGFIDQQGLQQSVLMVETRE